MKGFFSVILCLMAGIFVTLIALGLSILIIKFLITLFVKICEKIDGW